MLMTPLAPVTTTHAAPAVARKAFPVCATPITPMPQRASFMVIRLVATATLAALDAGYQAWDQTFNHVFNYTREGIDSANNANVTVTSVTICGSASAVGCTSTVVSSGHIQEGSSSIRFKSGLSTSTVTDAAAHEFGHYAGLGHSDVSTATMWATVHSGMDSLGTPDILGRCEIYGHSHAYWTSCTQT